jgi:hypothetical protein
MKLSHLYINAKCLFYLLQKIQLRLRGNKALIIADHIWIRHAPWHIKLNVDGLFHADMCKVSTSAILRDNQGWFAVATTIYFHMLLWLQWQR